MFGPTFVSFVRFVVNEIKATVAGYPQESLKTLFLLENTQGM